MLGCAKAGERYRCRPPAGAARDPSADTCDRDHHARVYEVIGVGILRQAWVNVDRLWAMALLVGAGATLLG